MVDSSDPNRLTRVVTILFDLLSGKTFSLKELMERYSIGKRQVLYDIQTLRDAGIPIPKGSRQGYWLDPMEREKLLQDEGIDLPHIALALNNPLQDGTFLHRTIKSVLSDKKKRVD